MNHSILKSIAKKHKCPVYVYDGNKIKKQYERLTNAFSSIKKLRIKLSNIKINYIKINRYRDKIG